MAQGEDNARSLPVGAPWRCATAMESLTFLENRYRKNVTERFAADLNVRLHARLPAPAVE